MKLLNTSTNLNNSGGTSYFPISKGLASTQHYCSVEYYNRLKDPSVPGQHMHDSWTRFHHPFTSDLCLKLSIKTNVLNHVWYIGCPQNLTYSL